MSAASSPRDDCADVDDEAIVNAIVTLNAGGRTRSIPLCKFLQHCNLDELVAAGRTVN